MQYDIIIIGGSYAGLAAGMALGRALRKVLIIDSGEPCNRQTPHSHNFLTNDGKAPAEIAALARAQVETYSTVRFLKAWVESARPINGGFEVLTEAGEVYTAQKLVFATGIRDLLPDLPGFAECWGISVLHCPYCHGYEVRQQKTGILANGDAGFELSALIAHWTNDLTLYTNGPHALFDEQLTRLKRHRINVVEAKIDHLEHQGGYVRNLVFEDGSKAPIKALYARVPFEQHSSLPQALGCELTAEGYIKTDAAQRTTVPGGYACGDNTSRMRTVANAVAMGTTTGMMVNKELIEAEF